MQNYSAGFTTQTQQYTGIALPIEGKLPDWLRGNLLRNGPAQFSVGKQRLNHWFDGLAMLHRFAISSQHITYTNKFLASRAYQRAIEKGVLTTKEFATNPYQHWWKNFFAPTTDNANINLSVIDGRNVAMTETLHWQEFAADLLTTQDAWHFQDKLAGHTTTAHPQYDFATNTIYNFVTHFSPLKSTYTVYAIACNSRERIPLASLAVKQPGYLHSFAMTARYVVLVEFPLLVNPLSLMFSGKPYIENFHWLPKNGTRFLVFDKQEKRYVGEWQSEACFAFHHVNAYEEKDIINIDLLAYTDAAIIKALYLDKLQQQQQQFPVAKLQRYQFSLHKSSVTVSTLSDASLELPRIHAKACQTKNYRYAYAVGASQPTAFTDQLVKIDVNNGKTYIWQEAYCYPGEPVFVAKPHATQEDDGVLLSIILDSKKQHSFLLILNASDMSPLARAPLPHIIPFGFHGEFFIDVK